MFLSYKIRVKTLEGEILTFHNVNEYKIEDGILIFTDNRKNILKRFSVTNSEIEETK